MRKRHHDREAIRHLPAQRDAKGLTFKQLSGRSGVPIHVIHHRAHADAHSAKPRARLREITDKLLLYQAVQLLDEVATIRCIHERGSG